LTAREATISCRRGLASDTWIDHESSQRAREALGFDVVDRGVHLKKGARNATRIVALWRLRAAF
jgi:hypothetical protein